MTVKYEQLRSRDKGIFKTVLALAERANEINSGKKPLVKSKSKRASTIALEEFGEGKLDFTQEA